MKIEVKNEEYNFIRKKLKILEDTYNQTNDPLVRITVKGQIDYDIYEYLPHIYSNFEKLLESCKMSSLKEILDMTDEILNSLEVIKMPLIDSKTAKKVLKLKDKQLKLFLKQYNERVQNENLTYFSTVVDDKFIVLTYKDGEFYGNVCTNVGNERQRENLCVFCNSFRKGSEITFITNTITKSGTLYASHGQYCCSDYELCNKDITNSEKMFKFLTYKDNINKKNGKIR